VKRNSKKRIRFWLKIAKDRLPCISSHTNFPMHALRRFYFSPNACVFFEIIAIKGVFLQYTGAMETYCFSSADRKTVED